jgi:hypothetical protein
LPSRIPIVTQQSRVKMNTRSRFRTRNLRSPRSWLPATRNLRCPIVGPWIDNRTSTF